MSRSPSKASPQAFFGRGSGAPGRRLRRPKLHFPRCRAPSNPSLPGPHDAARAAWFRLGAGHAGRCSPAAEGASRRAVTRLPRASSACAAGAQDRGAVERRSLPEELESGAAVAWAATRLLQTACRSPTRLDMSPTGRATAPSPPACRSREQSPRSDSSRSDGRRTTTAAGSRALPIKDWTPARLAALIGGKRRQSPGREDSVAALCVNPRQRPPRRQSPPPIGRGFKGAVSSAREQRRGGGCHSKPQAPPLPPPGLPGRGRGREWGAGRRGHPWGSGGERRGRRGAPG